MRRLSISAQISLVIAVFLASFVGLVVFSDLRLSSLGETVQRLSVTQAKRLLAVKELEKNAYDLQRFELLYIITPEKADRDTLAAKIETLTSDMRGDFKSLAEGATSDGLKNLSEMTEAMNAWQPLHESIRAHVRAGETAIALETARTKSSMPIETLITAAKAMAERNKMRFAKTAEETRRYVILSRIVMVALAGASFLIGLVFAVVMLRALTRKLKVAVARETDTEANSIRSTAASIDEIAATVQQNSENAKRTAAACKTNESRADQGKREVERTIAAMLRIEKSSGDVSEQVSASNRHMGEIVRMISEISTKTQVINDIVFQTKILAFNASVEAARAGANGKGFAVVAEEVGKLARMSGAAAADISTLLSENVSKVETIAKESEERVIRLMNEAKNTIAEGRARALACGGILDELLSSSREASLQVDSIATASEEQTCAVDHIRGTISQLDGSTQTNQQASKRLADSANQLKHEADTLAKIVSRMNEVTEGAKRS
jgi:methyl-accepting chemotaxis protein